uniref:Uncharacterized protein n=1 Tax=Lepeophtheirus salmonis TaxID=72036 RepID=A0A0K2UHA6_LEPSM
MILYSLAFKVPFIHTGGNTLPSELMTQSIMALAGCFERPLNFTSGGASLRVLVPKGAGVSDWVNCINFLILKNEDFPIGFLQYIKEDLRSFQPLLSLKSRQTLNFCYIPKLQAQILLNNAPDSRFVNPELPGPLADVVTWVCVYLRLHTPGSMCGLILVSPRPVRVDNVS